MRAERFDDALARLYEARDERPDDAELADAIRFVRERALRNGLDRLGSLESVPRRLSIPVPTSLGADERYLLGLVDGEASIDELLDASTLGRHRTVRALCTLLDRDMVRVDAITSAPVVTPDAALARHVLVADGHPPSAALTRTMLRLVLGAAARLETVGSVTQLTAAAQKQRPDLVVTETMLPGGDGVAALRTLRRAHGGAIPAIVIASRVELALVSGRAPDGCAVLARPIEKSALIDALATIGIARKA
ncbi:response regulator [Sandaracinus amylolyticus]|uniref:response regulator n=1 Tax=Sandaracinus amylolyticus TaxID=927083 RepID=UPI001F48D4B4|nr:response regulator [Sandaracinus amylolyticus]